MKTFDEYLNKKFENPEFREEYEALEPEFAIISALIEMRKSSGLTQKELARRTGIAQGDISKIENANANPSLDTLKRLAAGMNTRLNLQFIPIEKQSQNLRV